MEQRGGAGAGEVVVVAIGRARFALAVAGFVVSGTVVTGAVVAGVGAYAGIGIVGRGTVARTCSWVLPNCVVVVVVMGRQVPAMVAQKPSLHEQVMPAQEAFAPHEVRKRHDPVVPFGMHLELGRQSFIGDCNVGEMASLIATLWMRHFFFSLVISQTALRCIGASCVYGNPLQPACSVVIQPSSP